jgi:hypothetical protein
MKHIAYLNFNQIQLNGSAMLNQTINIHFRRCNVKEKISKCVMPDEIRIKEKIPI